MSEKVDYSKEMVEKNLSGSSASDIAGLYSCSKQKILKILKKSKVNMRSARTIHQINQELDKQKIKSREGKKWSWAAIRNIIQRFEQKILIIKNGGKYELR